MCKENIVETTGSSFTREFTITFQASEAVIKDWIAQSEGTQDADVFVKGDASIYQMKPGGGCPICPAYGQLAFFNSKAQHLLELRRRIYVN